MGKARKSKGPKEGSLAWERQLHKNPVYVKNTIKSLADWASQGNEQAAEALAAWLERHPEMRETVRQLDDLRTQTETAWVKALAGTDIVLEQAIRDDIAKMTAERLGENPSVLDRALASNVVVSYLADQRAVMWAAQAAQLPAVAAAGGRRAAGWPHGRTSSCSTRPPDVSGDQISEVRPWAVTRVHCDGVRRRGRGFTGCSPWPFLGRAWGGAGASRGSPEPSRRPRRWP